MTANTTAAHPPRPARIRGASVFELEQETASVQAFQPPAISDQRRQEIVGALRQYLAEVDGKHQPVSAREADDIINHVTA